MSVSPRWSLIRPQALTLVIIAENLVQNAKTPPDARPGGVMSFDFPFLSGALTLQTV
jgi:hypothetical protein